MLTLTEEQIKEIAGDLDVGMKCYYNKLTGEIKTIINSESWEYADSNAWDEDIEEIEENWSDYVEFESFRSDESFQIMVDYAESIDNKKLQEKLFNALNKSHPFRNFKWHIDNAGEYRQKWFDYKNQRFIDHVKEQIEVYNGLEEFKKLQENE